MQRHSKLLLTALTMALVLSIGASAATANRSLSITGELTTTLTGRLTMFVGGDSIICDITLTKRLNRAITKSANSALGNVTAVTVGMCRGEPAATFRINSVRFLGVNTARQWLLLYKSFEGMLPDIRGILFVITRMQILIEALRSLMAVRCLYENPSNTMIPMFARVEGAALEIVELRHLDLAALQEVPLLTQLIGSIACSRTLRIEIVLRPSQRTEVTLL